MIGGENYLLVGAVLLIIAVFAGKVAYRFGAPALLLFLGVGMFFGYNFISFDSAEFAQVVGMIALCSWNSVEIPYGWLRKFVAIRRLK